MCRHKKRQLLQLFLLLFCYLIDGHQLGPVQVIENNLEQTEEVKAKNIEMAQQIVEIREKNVNGKIENELLEVCNLLKCSSKNLDKFLKIQLLKMHPDKVGAENAKFAEEATKVINELRQFVQANPFEANEILTKNPKLTSATKGSDYIVQVYESKLSKVRLMRKNLFDNDLDKKLKIIEHYVQQNSKSMREKFDKMKKELIFHRQIFFNEDFEMFLKNIQQCGKPSYELKQFSKPNYDKMIEHIDELMVKLYKKKEEFDWSQLQLIEEKILKKMFDQKMEQILKWKTNAFLAKTEMEERHELEAQLRKIQTQKAAQIECCCLPKSKSAPALVSHKLLNLASSCKTLAYSSPKPSCKHIEQKISRSIVKKRQNEVYLINAPNNDPTEVHKKWQHWESLHYTSAFFNAIEDMYLFNVEDERPLKFNNKMFHG